MSAIHVLPSQVVEHVAAGEVVERGQPRLSKS